MGFGATQILTGITKLSELGIDVHKSWGGYRIETLGTPVNPPDAATKAYVDDKLAAISVDYTSKTLDTNYQNTSGKIRVVIATADGYIYPWKLGGDAAAIQAIIGLSSPPITQIAEDGIRYFNDSNVQGITLEKTLILTFIVPPGYYYRVARYESGLGYVAGVVTWTEFDLL